MLSALTIKNVVLIDYLTVEFEKGLCALTGETGAGKSILLDSLGLALGARSESGLVRKGEPQALVTASFEIPQTHPVFAFLHEHAIEADGQVILRRSVATDGKSRAFINDQPVSVSLLKSVGEMLVEIHGQFDTQTLLNPKTHRGLVDEYAGVAADIARLKMAWESWKQAEQEYTKKKAGIENARAEKEYLRTALEQLDDLSPALGEEEKLTTLRARLMRREQVIENLKGAEKSSEDALSHMNVTWRSLEKAGEGQGDIMSGIDRAMAEMHEVCAGIQSIIASISDSEYSLPEIDDRLFALKAQARKHACTIEELSSKRAEIANLLKGIDGGGDDLAAMEKDIKAKKQAYVTQAESISQKRTQAGKKLDTLVGKELAPLKLEKARFETAVEKMAEADWGPEGYDRVQFLVATNPGAAAGALNKIASGGEMARFMLALKVVLAEVGCAQTLVFDEVDSGIGGATADAVGQRLARLSQKRQILVVTHSPQVAAKSSYHAIVVKTGKTNPTTKILPLANSNERREEIARMLSGEEITNEARAQADKLLEKSVA